MIRQSDIVELKSRIKGGECSFTRFAGALVNPNKDIVANFNKPFLTLEESELMRYLEIVRKTYSTKLEKNTLQLEFDTYENARRQQDLLNKLVDSGLKNEELVYEFYYSVIDNYEYADYYLILLFHDRYDVVKHAKDGTSLEESEDVYSYIHCVICPVSMEKAGLQYLKEKNTIGKIEQDRIVGKPRIAFIYPAFEERSAEWDHVMYYTQKPKDSQHSVITSTLGCKNVFTSAEAKEMFEKTVKSVVGNIEDSERYLKKINVELQNWFSYAGYDETVLTQGDFNEILEKIEFPQRIELLERYKSLWKGQWPKIAWLYDAGKVEAFNEDVKRNKLREMLSKAKKHLEVKDDHEMAKEIEKYLEGIR